MWLPVCVEASEGHVRPQDTSDVCIKMMPRNHCVFSMCFADLNNRHLLCLSFKPYIGRHQACYNDQWYQNHANGVHQAAIKGIKKTSEVDFWFLKNHRKISKKTMEIIQIIQIPHDFLDHPNDMFATEPRGLVKR